MHNAVSPVQRSLPQTHTDVLLGTTHFAEVCDTGYARHYTNVGVVSAVDGVGPPVTYSSP